MKLVDGWNTIPTAWERKGVGGKVRAALTPDPSPALRERGDLDGGHGSVDRCQRRIASAPLIPPFRSGSVEEEEGLGGGEGRLACSTAQGLNPLQLQVDAPIRCTGVHPSLFLSAIILRIKYQTNETCLNIPFGT